ncbi:hypothetical protein [Methylobacterium sp. WSM2598]|uniref:hypothetical protein n=1 Tax=Methylobacterium sp. WSM2598 TaxID=398261 RepID=UPI00036393BA|nr:hypothetical protein [Methylobacterium sp. WSM2598]
MAQRQMFDEQAREKIRRDLLRYNVAYNLGAPTLAKLISTANDVDVDHRRVGRFLAGHTERRKSDDPKHKPTNPDPIFLGWCAKFLESAKLPPDPLDAMANSLLAVYSSGQAIPIPEGDYYSEDFIFNFSIRHRYAVVDFQRFMQQWADGIIIAAQSSLLIVLKDRFNSAPMFAILRPSLEGILVTKSDTQPLKLTTTPPVFAVFASGSSVTYADRPTMADLKHAIIKNRAEWVRDILSIGVDLAPDAEGRWPSTIAGMRRASEEICDMLADAELAAGSV